MPETVLQFRPITCCNTIYKCLSKVLCNRRRNILPDIVSPSQSAFIKGRDIVGNILISQDLIKLYKRKTCSPRVLIKLDLQKAYDFVEWSFAEGMLKTLGFHQDFRDYLEAQEVPLPSPLPENQAHSSASGLVINRGKSNIYFNGTDEQLIKKVEDLTVMKRGSVPFKYLGVIVSPKRLSVLDCSSLVDRIVERIKRLGSRKLSFAAVCRSFLWHGNEHKESSALVSWDAICQPKRQGGLGLKHFHEWNVAAIAKYAWWIAVKDDHLWVKDTFKELLFESKWSRSGLRYTIGTGYNWLMPEKEQVSWYPWVKKRWIIPEHSFYCWLVVPQRLLTQDRLMRMHILNQNCCYLCGAKEETHDHLFFDCVFSVKCKNLVSSLCKVRFPNQNSIEWWLNCRSRNIGRKKGMAVILASLYYWIWTARNKCRVDGFLWRPEFILQRVRSDCCMRLSMIKSTNAKFVTWFASIK
ncbi:uncharacterized protein LOC141602115 [Silene latifolia]|uniref:uncharacterized protein LOC141602115 n=1 Tax=Silene latifolia TaxID=37657 RepID=UPI003D76C35E